MQDCRKVNISSELSLTLYSFSIGGREVKSGFPIISCSEINLLVRFDLSLVIEMNKILSFNISRFYPLM